MKFFMRNYLLPLLVLGVIHVEAQESELALSQARDIKKRAGLGLGPSNVPSYSPTITAPTRAEEYSKAYGLTNQPSTPRRLLFESPFAGGFFDLSTPEEPKAIAAAEKFDEKFDQENKIRAAQAKGFGEEFEGLVQPEEPGVWGRFKNFFKRESPRAKEYTKGYGLEPVELSTEKARAQRIKEHEKAIKAENDNLKALERSLKPGMSVASIKQNLGNKLRSFGQAIGLTNFDYKKLANQAYNLTFGNVINAWNWAINQIKAQIETEKEYIKGRLFLPEGYFERQRRIREYVQGYKEPIPLTEKQALAAEKKARAERLKGYGSWQPG
ncbi:MAG: hypothetical protein WA432_00870 [Candidatus Babeliaceae bacterium]